MNHQTQCLVPKVTLFQYPKVVTKTNTPCGGGFQFQKTSVFNRAPDTSCPILFIFCFKEPSEPKADRPAWMEELRSKQAHRKSGLFGKER